MVARSSNKPSVRVTAYSSPAVIPPTFRLVSTSYTLYIQLRYSPAAGRLSLDPYSFRSVRCVPEVFSSFPASCHGRF